MTVRLRVRVYCPVNKKAVRSSYDGDSSYTTPLSQTVAVLLGQSFTKVSAWI